MFARRSTDRRIAPLMTRTTMCVGELQTDRLVTRTMYFEKNEAQIETRDIDVPTDIVIYV